MKFISCVSKTEKKTEPKSKMNPILVIVDTTATPALYILSVNSILAGCVAL